MFLSSQQRYRLSSLGLKAAAAVLSGDHQEPERHIPVSGQIRGYLRWYGSLTYTKGYWPLAEIIALSIKDGTFSTKTLKRLTEQFAGEWSSTPEQIREEMTTTVQEAMASHPDFASFVMGGIPQTNFLREFVEASVRWLKHYRLALCDFAWGEQEAVWVRQSLRPQPNLDRTTPYISTEDYWLVSELYRGRGRELLAKKLDCTVEYLDARYHQAIERAETILSKISDRQIPAGRTDWEIADYLEAMGLSVEEGQPELETAIRLGRDQPHLLEHMTELFYPTVAGMTGRPASTVSHRIRTAIDKLAKNPVNAEFFRTGGMAGGTSTNVKKFIHAFLQYTGHEGRRA